MENAIGPITREIIQLKDRVEKLEEALAELTERYEKHYHEAEKGYPCED